MHETSRNPYLGWIKILLFMGMTTIFHEIEYRNKKSALIYVPFFSTMVLAFVIDFTKRYDYGNQTHNLFMFCYQSSSCFVQLICFSCVI